MPGRAFETACGRGRRKWKPCTGTLCGPTTNRAAAVQGTDMGRFGRAVLMDATQHSKVPDLPKVAGPVVLGSVPDHVQWLIDHYDPPRELTADTGSIIEQGGD